MVRLINEIKKSIVIDDSKDFMFNLMYNIQNSYFVRLIYFAVWFEVLITILSGVYLIFLYGIFKDIKPMEHAFGNQYFVSFFPFVSWIFAVLVALPVIGEEGNKTYFTGLPWWQKIIGASIEYSFVFAIANIVAEPIISITGSYNAEIFIALILIPYIIGCIRRKPPEEQDS